MRHGTFLGRDVSLVQAGAGFAAGGDAVRAGTAVNLFMAKGTSSAVWTRWRRCRPGDRLAREVTMGGGPGEALGTLTGREQAVAVGGLRRGLIGDVLGHELS